MRSVAVLVALAATAVTAQVQNFTSSLNMTVDPNTVPQQQRAVWCQAQTNTCQLLCGSNTDQNDCNQANLSYDCTCSSNHSAPGLQFYTQTMPTFVCQQLFSQCIAQNAGSQDSQKACKTNIEKLCGTINPPSEGIVATTAADSKTTAAPDSTATHTAGVSQTGSSSAQSTTHADFAAPTLAPGGTGAMAVAAVGLLAYLL
ncbi:hypothetical protein PT974_11472 [Cladobotryum mycophilum]|uniref:DUF7707 domain-containing protein n=1 Tax=Cladobotryum mycophilum TaxID=491253 RepID=A0ABR0S6C6_9HYPO